MNNVSAAFQCRPGCAACCLVISISSPLPAHPNGKAAGETCRHLNPQALCRLWGQADYPACCRNFSALLEHCGHTSAEAIRLLAELEQATQP